MKIENKEMIEQFDKFISSVTPDDHVCVLHDTDMDGMTAGVLCKKGLESVGIVPTLTTPMYHGERKVSEEFLKNLKSLGVNVLIAVDLPLESYECVELLKDMRVLVIDHHPIEREYKDILVIKPQLMELSIDPSRICAANLVYNLFMGITDMSSYDWIAAIGIMADSTYPTEKEFVDSVLKKNGNEVGEDVFETDFARAVGYGTYADCVGTEDAQKKIFEALDKASNYKDVISGLVEFAPVEDEVNKLIDEFDAKKEELEGDLIFYDIHAEHGVNSIVSTILSHKKVPHNTLVVAEEREDDYKISGRRQDMKVHVGDMFRDCIKGLDGANGGGHRPAAGARVLKKDYETFKNRVKEWCKE